MARYDMEIRMIYETVIMIRGRLVVIMVLVMWKSSISMN